MKERLERFWEPLVGAAALATLPFLLFENHMAPMVLFYGDLAIWAVFTLAFVSVLIVCPNGKERLKWVRRSWLEILIILGSMPILPSSLQSLRLMGLVRLLRVLRLGRIMAVVYFLRWTRRKFALSPVAFAGSTTVLLVFLGANALHCWSPPWSRTFGAESGGPSRP